MIHVQVVSRSGENLQTLIRAAMAEGRIRSLTAARVKGGLRLKHPKYKGELRLTRTAGPLLVTVVSKEKSREFQLLETFIGRLTYHFRNEISAINIQLDPDE